jgi:hypothetical protein
LLLAAGLSALLTTLLARLLAALLLLTGLLPALLLAALLSTLAALLVLLVLAALLAALILLRHFNILTTGLESVTNRPQASNVPHCDIKFVIAAQGVFRHVRGVVSSSHLNSAALYGLAYEEWRVQPFGKPS